MNCSCGHSKSSHIYEEGACRPGFPCACLEYNDKNETLSLSDRWREKYYDKVQELNSCEAELKTTKEMLNIAISTLNSLANQNGNEFAMQSEAEEALDKIRSI